MNFKQMVQILNEKIVKVMVDGEPKWQVQSHEGKNLGTYPYTKEGKHQAHIRLGQVEAFKKKNESLDESTIGRIIMDDAEKQGYNDGYSGKELEIPEKFKDNKLAITSYKNGYKKGKDEKMYKESLTEANIIFSISEDALEDWVETKAFLNRNKIKYELKKRDNNVSFEVDSKYKDVIEHELKRWKVEYKLDENLRMVESMELQENKIITIKYDSEWEEFSAPYVVPKSKNASKDDDGLYHDDDLESLIGTIKAECERQNITDYEIKLSTSASKKVPKKDKEKIQSLLANESLSKEVDMELQEESKDPEKWEQAMKDAEKALKYRPTAKEKKEDPAKYDKFYATATGIYKKLMKPESNIDKVAKKLASESITEEVKTREIYEIANDIKDNWKKVNYAAKPYLNAMGSLKKITDNYGYDSASSIISYFLSNASSWRGDKAKEIKAELNTLLGKSK